MMNAAYLNLIAAAGADEISHIGLVDGENNELDSASYARKPVTWTSPSNGNIAPNANLEFDVAEGDEVEGWQGYNALEDGTAYGIVPLTPVTFNNDGTYTLLAASTGIDHDAA